MCFQLDDKREGCIMINTTQRGAVTYFLHEKAYEINNSEDCHVQGVAWDVIASEDGTIHYSVTMYYKKDYAGATIKKSDAGYLKSNKIWFESISGNYDDFKCALETKINSLTNVHSITQKSFVVKDEIQYFAIITHSDKNQK